MKRTLFIALLFFSVRLITANTTFTQNIRGTVIDQVTGFPLIGANVIILNSETPVGATTDMNGTFMLENLPVGRQSIEIRYIGYKSKVLPNLLLTSAKELVLNIKLEEEAVAVDEVVVKATKRKDHALNEMATVSARTFSIEETERFAGSLGDPARMVANYAGVATGDDSRNDIIIRGNSPSGVLWRLEGIEIPNPNHFGALGTTGGPVSMVNNNLLTNSDFLTGAFPAEYGNATAGAFDLNLRSGNNENREFTGQVGFNGFELGAEGPLARLESGVNPSYVANFRYSTLEVMHDLGFGSGTGAAVPEYKDFTFLVDVPGTKFGRFKLFGLWGTSYIELGREISDTSENSYSSKGTATDFGSNLAVGGLTHTYFLNPSMRFKSTLSYQTTSATTQLDSIREEGDYVLPWIRSVQREDKLSFTTQFKHKVNTKNNYSIGAIIDYMHIDYIDSIYMPEYSKFITSADVGEYMQLDRAYAQWQHKFNNKLTGYAGVHMQSFSLNNETAIEPRLSLRWQMNPKQSINLGYGKHSQLQPRVTYYFNTYNEENDSYQRTNEDVGFTKSDHYVLGFDQSFNKDFRLRIETYYQNLYNIPVSENFPEFSMINSGASFGIPREDNLVNSGTGENYGIELTLEKFLSKGYYFLLTASIFDSKYKGSDKIERNTAFNSNFVFNVLAGYEYKFSEKAMITFDIKSVLAGGKRYVPIDIQESIATKSEVRDWSTAYDNRYNNYFRTDVRIGFKLNSRRISQEWGLDLQNITNYRNVFFEGFDLEKMETYKVHQQGFMPMMLYRINF